MPYVKVTFSGVVFRPRTEDSAGNRSVGRRLRAGIIGKGTDDMLSKMVRIPSFAENEQWNAQCERCTHRIGANARC